MTEDEFKIIEQRMAINRGEVVVPEVGEIKGPSYADAASWPEHMIEAECTRLLEQDGWRALRTDPVSDRGRGKGFGEIGMADHWYWRPAAQRSQYGPIESVAYPAVVLSLSQTLWIEFKSADGEPSKAQLKWHTIERARGALTWIAGVDFPASVAGFVAHYRASGLNRGRV